jgi:CubicO group peptidase (beta-lactamase class C family)
LSVFAALLAIVVGCAARQEIPSVPPEKAGLSSAKLREVDAVMKRFVTEGKIAGGIVMIARNGKIALFEPYGMMDREAGKPMRRDTIFRIYSMTKPIVSAAALILVEEGRLDLDDPVEKHVPELKDLKVRDGKELRKVSRSPSVEDLMLHTAGFIYGWGGGDLDKEYQKKKPLEASDLDDMAARLAGLPLAFDPGTDWIYSLSIDLLGLVIERVSGRRLDRFLEERIFKPLDMRDTRFHVPPESVDRFATNYRRGKKGLEVIDAPGKSRYLKPPGLLSGGGGLVGTARDYMRFLMMIEGGGQLQGRRILKPETVRRMTTNQLPKKAFPIYFGKQIRHGTGFGLGFSVSTADTEWDPKGRVGEFGWGGAASTHFWVSPRDRLIVITLEQIMPFTFDTEFALKGIIYDALLEP